jgi:hypothetical protein
MSRLQARWILPLTAVSLLACLSLPATGQTRQTIVGKWSTIAGKCVRPVSLIQIAPKSLSGDDFFCDFSTVRRNGNVVVFTGQCTFGDDPPRTETVVARLTGQRLHYRFASERGENGPFIRCR